MHSLGCNPGSTFPELPRTDLWKCTTPYSSVLDVDTFYQLVFVSDKYSKLGQKIYFQLQWFTICERRQHLGQIWGDWDEIDVNCELFMQHVQLGHTQWELKKPVNPLLYFLNPFNYSCNMCNVLGHTQWAWITFHFLEHKSRSIHFYISWITLSFLSMTQPFAMTGKNRIGL